MSMRKLYAFNYVKLSEMGEWVREMGEYLGEGGNYYLRSNLFPIILIV